MSLAVGDSITATERKALQRVGALDVLLVANRECEEAAHFVCWRIACRPCGQTLVPHVGVERVRAQIATVRTAHTCQVRKPRNGA